ncbi:hypothetical protein KXV68_003746 [Aspergillus fumigatus]|uniref:Integral membrane protein n=1 Tax=Aspergillus fumigatus (strain ATCC MYA-4609 / CBS 101355 / FGSC A1100 / Af293) TaxID=330879 RepID=Q4W8Y6_ASPFU|nr:integral membrane protein [Aspergillus fumigatus Af293]KAH1336483.1 hypothetical protein KXX67_002948 [Aspergillus fumigatus]EAL84233.1 integral membrane protein [Aspergillus fumigatus Af293]KAH1638393.1 hypothetical protein KXX39_005547 [Aspergillus fumigatus]KAH1725330.1 hypothetical protein KXX25_000291 [Aspergillus fumigatus]KAH1726252.1 hypothetical protein KXX40_000332 [Aspergillus fumigatus]
MSTRDPLFIAQEAVCFYPISTIYDSCPRYLFYALLLASCVTRWTGWLADVFLGAAATYAGVAAIQAFILVSSPSSPADPGPVTIPYLPKNTSLWDRFPQLITGRENVIVRPAAVELDADAVSAIVITGYLVFLPLQCWSRVLSQERIRVILFYLWNILMFAGSICALIYSSTAKNTPTQSMFCYPDLPPFDESSSDGWQASWRTSTWNNSVWSIFSNVTLWGQLGDICFNPCFNSSQILRQQTSLEVWVATSRSELDHPHSFWNKFIYSRRYIYSLLGVTVILNIILLVSRFFPYRSRIPSVQMVVVWRERKAIWTSFREGFCLLKELACQNDIPSRKISTWHRCRSILSRRFAKECLRLLADSLILIGLLLSIIISPLTLVAFVVWIEWYIHNDGPSQENPQQVGQWSSLVSIGLLLISALILRWKYRVASSQELDEEIYALRERLADVEGRRLLRAEASH